MINVYNMKCLIQETNLHIHHLTDSGKYLCVHANWIYLIIYASANCIYCDT